MAGLSAGQDILNMYSAVRNDEMDDNLAQKSEMGEDVLHPMPSFLTSSKTLDSLLISLNILAMKIKTSVNIKVI